jgi:hypothetical protein
MATKKKRPLRGAAKRLAPKKRSRPSADKKRASKSTTVRRKERKVEVARHRLMDAEKELAVEQLPDKGDPAAKKGVARIPTHP